MHAKERGAQHFILYGANYIGKRQQDIWLKWRMWDNLIEISNSSTNNVQRQEQHDGEVGLQER
jgi:hypothetical protein